MSDSVTRYVRYGHAGGVFYGILDGETIQEIDGGLFGERAPTGKTVQLGDVKLRYPCEPSKVLCVGLNYRSHLGDHPAPANPEIFYKPPTALADPGDDIVFPPGARDVHYEAELVVVIGKTAKGISAEDAGDHIFGYTCGNDVSDRNWQLGSLGDPQDLQWWRAKGSDTFGPLGPAIAAGLDVYATEPVAGDNPLLALDNVVLSPHIAWLTPETLARSLTIAVENTRRIRDGEALLHRVV